MPKLELPFHTASTLTGHNKDGVLAQRHGAYDGRITNSETEMLKEEGRSDGVPEVLCRSAEPKDEARVASLFRELQEFHHQPLQEASTVLRQIQDRPSNFEIIVAEIEGCISGFALINTYPGPGIAPGFYLKELFVTTSARKLGIGRVLMGYIANTAVERGFSRVDWVTTKDNAAARSFYDRLGAVMNAEKVFYRLDGTALEELSRPLPAHPGD